MTELAHRVGVAVPSVALLFLSAACTSDGASPWVVGGECGGSGQACCAGSSCSGTLSCSDGECQACGGSDQPCCASGNCTGDLSCQSGTCKCPSDSPVFCDYPGTAQCSGCWAAGTDCSLPVAACSDNLCHICPAAADSHYDCALGECCGGHGMRCCSSNTCSSGYTCQSGTCQCPTASPNYCAYPGNAGCTGCWNLPCKSPVTMCGTDGTCHFCSTSGEGYVCASGSGGACVAGCGGNGQPCCSTGTACKGVLECTSGACQCGSDFPVFCDHPGDSSCTGCWQPDTNCSNPVITCNDNQCHGCTSSEYHYDCAAAGCVHN